MVLLFYKISESDKLAENPIFNKWTNSGDSDTKRFIQIN